MNPAPSTRPDRRRLLGLALALATLLVGVGAYNCYWDPYGKFRARPVTSAFGVKTSYPLLSILELNRIAAAQVGGAEAILVGDSRAYQLTPGRTATAGGLRVLNLAVPGGSFEEALSLLALEAPRLKGARLLVVDAPMERFAERPSPDRCREAWPLGQSLLRYALNWQTCQDSWMMARYLRKGVTTARIYTGKKEELPEVDRNIVNYWREMFRGYDPAIVEKRLKLLRETLAPWQARGVKVTFWAPPLRRDLHGLIPEFGLEEVWPSIAQELRRMGPVIDMKYDEGLPGIPFTFKDPVHVAEGGAILERLLRENRD